MKQLLIFFWGGGGFSFKKFFKILADHLMLLHKINHPFGQWYVIFFNYKYIISIPIPYKDPTLTI